MKMMKSKYKLLLIGGLFALSCVLMQSCAGTHVSAGVGVGVDFGPHGAHLHPNVNVGIYNGGRY